MHKRPIRIPLVLVLPALLLAACDSIDFSLVIHDNLAPEEGCSWVLPSGDEYQFIKAGVLDLAYPGFALGVGAPSYYLHLLIYNYLLPDLNADSGRLNSRAIMLQSFEIDYTWLRGYDEIAALNSAALEGLTSQHVSVPMAHVIGSADDSGEPGKALLGLNVLPASEGRMLDDLAMLQGALEALDRIYLGVEVRAVGTTLGGTRVESMPFVYPISFCFNCLAHRCPAPFQNFFPGCHAGQDYNDYSVCPAATTP
jgi:hypothetical protein